MPYNDDYFNSKSFRCLLEKFRKSEQNMIHSIFDPEEYVDLAEYFYNNNQKSKGYKIIDLALQIYPGALSPLLFKARVELLDNNNPVRAAWYVEQIEDKSDLEYIYIKGEIMVAQKQIEEADNYYEQHYITLDAEEKSYYEIDISNIFFDYEVIDKGLKWFARCSNKQLLEYMELEAKVEMIKGNFKSSQKLYNKLIDNNPFNIQYWNSLASSQFFNDEIEEAISSSEYSIAINPDNAAALLNKANGLYKLGNYEEALKYYIRYNRINTADESGEILIGLCYLLLEKFEDAISFLSKAAMHCEKNSPNLVDIYKDLSYAMCRLGRIDEGLAMLDKMDEIVKNPNDLLVNKGIILIGCGHFDKAKKYFVKALKQSNYDRNIFLKIAITVYESGDPTLAYRMFTTVYKQNEHWYKGYAFYAACCHDLNKKEEFLQSLRLAVKYTPYETQEVLGVLFPDKMPVEEYYDYMRQKLQHK